MADTAEICTIVDTCPIKWQNRAPGIRYRHCRPAFLLLFLVYVIMSLHVPNHQS